MSGLYVASAQQFQTISVKDGISDRNIQCIAEDHLGYIWLATLGGLDRYDGYNIDKYSQRSFGLMYDSFKFVAEDGGEHLWTVSSGGQIYLYDWENDCLTDDIEPILSELGIPYGPDMRISVDQGKNLWVDFGDSLYRYVFASQKLDTFSTGKFCRSIASSGITAFAAFSDGEVWQLSPEKRLLPISEDAGPCSLSLDSSGRLWRYGIGLESLSYFDQREGNWHLLDLAGLSDGDRVNAVIDDGEGRLWVSTVSSGLLILDESDFQVSRRIKHVSGDRQALPSNHINGFMLGRNNILWIATANNGVALTTLESIQIDKILLDYSEDVGTLQEDSKGNIWIGLDGDGLFCYKDQSLTHFDKKSSDIPSDNIVGSVLLSDGTLVFASYGGGVFTWDGHAATPLQNPDPDFSESTRYSRTLCPDAYGNLWINTFGQGIGCLSSSGEWKRFTRANSQLLSNGMTSLASSREGDVLFASNNECIYRIQPKTATLEKFLECWQVRNLFMDSRDVLWIGTSEGLYYFDTRRNGPLFHLKESDGLSNMHIQGMGEDRKGNMWVTTDNGFTYIYVIDDPVDEKMTVRCYPFYEEDGIGDCMFANGAVLLTSSGEVLMGGGGQVLSINPENFRLISHPLSLRLTGMNVSGKEMNIRRFNEQEKIRIKYNDNLNLQVSAMDFTNRNKIRYEYAIDNEETWNPMQGNKLSVNSFQPGKHTIYVRIAGAGDAAVMPLSIQFKTTPPPWRSLIAYLLYIFLIFSAFSLVVVSIKSRNRKLLDQERHETDESRLRFFTNISHDLRTPLTMIIAPLGKLLDENRGMPIEKDLSLAYNSAQALRDEIDQLLEFRTVDKAKLSFNPSYGNLTKFTEDVCDSYERILADSSVKLIVDLNEKPLMMDFDRDKMKRIIQNLLSNAFKYNTPGGYVKVSLSQIGENAQIIVEDSGIGVSDENKQRIFERFYQTRQKDAATGNGIGLNIVAEYVKLHGGQVTVTDNYPKGSVFTVTLPIRHETETKELVESQTVPSLTDKTQLNKKRVLIVEDNDSFRGFLRESLSGSYDVIEADNGRTGLEKLASCPVDIIVSDIMMPEMDGLAFCREVKKDIRYSSIPIILLTARQQETALEGLRVGADGYISKPFNLEMLTLKIDNLLKWSRNSHSKANDQSLSTSETASSKFDKDLLDKTIATIESHLSDSEFSVEALSAEVGVSRSGLYKKLLAITGKSPLEFIRIIKLKHGLELLEKGDASISQIAWSVGFSPKQFSKYFKEEYGCLPSEYRQNVQ